MVSSLILSTLFAHNLEYVEMYTGIEIFDKQDQKVAIAFTAY